MATPLTGTFNMSGVVTATATGINFYSDQLGSAANEFTITGGTGSFTGLSGSESIQSIANETVNTVFAPAAFISITGIPTTLNIDEVYGGTSSNTTLATCSAATGPGSTCTPDYLAPVLGSPFTFSEGSGGQSSVEWAVTGVTSDGLSTWNAIFTAQFGAPFQTELGLFQSSGSLTNSYSATATVTVTPNTPEPGTMFFVSGGICLLFGCFRLRRRSIA